MEILFLPHELYPDMTGTLSGCKYSIY